MLKFPRHTRPEAQHCPVASEEGQWECRLAFTRVKREQETGHLWMKVEGSVWLAKGEPGTLRFLLAVFSEPILVRKLC